MKSCKVNVKPLEQEAQSVPDSMNLPKFEFISEQNSKLLGYISFYAPNFVKVEGAYCFGLVRYRFKIWF